MKMKIRSVYKVLTIFIYAIAVMACTPVNMNVNESLTQLDQSVKQSKSILDVPVPKDVMNSLLHAQVVKKIDPPEPTFDVSVNEMPAKSFFVSLVANSNINVVTHPEVEGAISLDLKNVTLPEVLEVTRDVYGYEFKQTGSIYSIYPRTMRTEIFEINYIDVERIGETNTSVLIGAIPSSSSQQGVGGGNNAQNNQQDQGIGSGSKVETKSTTNFWQDLTNTIEAIISIGEEGKSVTVNPQAGLVIINALPNEISAVRSFLDRSELSVRRQVILEAKIVEVKLSEGFEAGVNWSEIQGQMLLTNNVSSFTLPTDISGVSQEAGEIFSSIFNIGDMSRLLSLLETQGAVQVLSSPRISTVNNQKALIRVGSDEFFVTGIANETTSTASATSTAPNIELTSFFSGISLDVTPQIAENGEIILHVHPIVSNVIDQNKVIRLGDDEFSLPLALREVRESDSIVRAESGQVVVLGGLMKEQTVDVNGKRPGLGDVPILNLLFKTKQKSKEKTELVILLRPIIVDEKTYENDLKNTYERVEKISNFQ